MRTYGAALGSACAILAVAVGHAFGVIPEDVTLPLIIALSAPSWLQFSAPRACRAAGRS